MTSNKDSDNFAFKTEDYPVITDAQLVQAVKWIAEWLAI